MKFFLFLLVVLILCNARLIKPIANKINFFNNNNKNVSYNPGYLYCLSSSKTLLSEKLVSSTFYYNGDFQDKALNIWEATWLLSVCNECPCFQLEKLVIEDSISSTNGNPFLYTLDSQIVSYVNKASQGGSTLINIDLSPNNPFSVLLENMPPVNNIIYSGDCNNVDKCSPDLNCVKYQITHVFSYIDSELISDPVMCFDQTITNSIHSESVICSTPQSDKMIINAKLKNDSSLLKYSTINKYGDCPTCTSCSNSDDYYTIPSFSLSTTTIINPILVCVLKDCQSGDPCQKVECTYTFTNPLSTAISFDMGNIIIPGFPFVFSSSQCKNDNPQKCYVDGGAIFTAIITTCISLDDNIIVYTMNIHTDKKLSTCDNKIVFQDKQFQLTIPSFKKTFVSISPSPLKVDCHCDNLVETSFDITVNTNDKCTCVRHFQVDIQSPVLISSITPNSLEITCAKQNDYHYICMSASNSHPLGEYDIKVGLLVTCKDKCPPNNELLDVTSTFSLCDTSEYIENDQLSIEYDCPCCEKCKCTAQGIINSGSHAYLEIDLADNTVGVAKCDVYSSNAINYIGSFYHVNRWDAYVPLSLQQYSRLDNFITSNTDYFVKCCASTPQIQQGDVLFDNCLSEKNYLTWSCVAKEKKIRYDNIWKFPELQVVD